MILSRLGGMSVYAMQQTSLLGMDENTLYRDNEQSVCKLEIRFINNLSAVYALCFGKGRSGSKGGKMLCH
jgi:hypothetical protein